LYYNHLATRINIYLSVVNQKLSSSSSILSSVIVFKSSSKLGSYTSNESISASTSPSDRTSSILTSSGIVGQKGSAQVETSDQ
jgi:hypothetical protein